MFRTGRCLSLFLAVLMVLSTAPAVWAQETANSDKLLADTLRQYVEELKSEPEAEGMVVGYEVYSLDREETLASLREEKTFVPASTLKLLVTATVLDLWPEDLRFSTELYVDGKLSRGGVLHGDVVLKGYGDPLLTPEQLKELAEALAEKGVRRVHGNLVVDDSYFDDKRLGTNWMWDDEPYDYSAQIGALTVNKNTVDVKVEPTSPGKKPEVSVTPAPGYVKVVNRAETVEGEEADLTIERPRLKNEIIVTGTIGEAYTEKDEENDEEHHYYEVTRTIEEPDLFTGHVLRDELEDVGIKIHRQSEIVSGKLEKGAKLIAETQSPELDEILHDFVKESDNLVAEMLVKQLGAREREEGTTEAGIEVIETFVRDRAGMGSGFVQKDGSGLARQNVISPHHLVQLLKAMDEHPAHERFRSFLPVAGVDGTLENRMKDTPAAGNVQAKTGSMSGVNSLAGYVETAEGEKLAFSISMNGVYKSKYARDLQDRIAVALATYPDLPEDPVPLPPEETYPLSAAIDPILDDEGYNGVMKGVMVRSLDSGETLYERNARSLMTPASNTKLFTSSTALAKLGPDYRFRTELYVDGKLTKGGVLHGDLVIKGYGDPTLATEGSLRVQDGPTIEQMAADIRQLGIRRIQGDIIVDATAFPDEVYGTGWAWDNESDYYQPQITALSINRGTVRFDYLPGDKPGDPIQLTLTPQTRYVKVIDDAVTGQAGSKNTLKIERERGTNTIHLTGSLPLDFAGDYTRITVEKPHVYTGHVLQEQLLDKGVRLRPKSAVREEATPGGAELVHTYQSPPLSEVVRYLNYYSDNFYAEMILKTVGLETRGEGTFENGLKAVRDHNKHLDLTSHADMMDGSGLTRYNLFSAQQLVSLLTAMQHEPEYSAFYNSLPVAGEEGALRNRMRGTAAEHNLCGKTGSMTHVRALSGYVETKDGEQLAYAILTNGFTEQSLTELENRFGVALAEFSRQ